LEKNIVDENRPADLVCEGIPAREVTFREAFWVWVKVALNSFGGPAAQIAVMHRYLVEERRWISEERFLHALNYCMLLPGPEAQQLAIYIGWLLHKTWGGIVAGALFVIPGFLFMLILSVLYAGYRDLSFIEWLFFGLKPAVLAIVLEAVLRIGKRALKTRLMVAFSALAFVAIFFYDVPFPVIVLSAAATGFVGGKFFPEAFMDSPPVRSKDSACDTPVIDSFLDLAHDSHLRSPLVSSVMVVALWSSLWFAPVLAIYLYLGSQNVYFQEALFFSKTAIVTFGGAYAVLAYVAQQAVDFYGWLKPGEMLDGLGLAETTPGPLILVLQFVGFIAAYRNPGGLDPALAGVLGAILTVWVTFVPCFLFIFAGAPYIEALRGNKSLGTALSCITAAVVGVVLNLAVWLALNTIFGSLKDVYVLGAHVQVPILESANLASLAITIGAVVALFRLKLGMIYTIVGCAGTGIAYHAFKGLAGY
jgi:chromate transporter